MSAILAFILDVDRALFAFINSTLTHEWADVVMSLVTKSRSWIPVFVLGLIFLLVRCGSKGRFCVLTLLLAVGIADPLNSRVIKPAFERVRPSHALSDARVLVPDNGGASFPSTHATNMFAAAFVLTAFYPLHRRYWWFIAALIAYSRVYVGVHYPTDVTAGALEGILIGMLCVTLVRRLFSSRLATFS